MGSILGKPRSYHKKFKFIVEIDGVASARFKTCSELSAEIAVIEQFEGGDVIPEDSPGRVTFTEVTLERGATSDTDLYEWFKQVIDAAAGIGLEDEDYKRNFDIVQLGRTGATLLRWTVTGAWVKKYVAGDWGDADENVTEAVTLKFKYFERQQV